MPALPVIAIATAAIATGASIYEGEKSAKLQKSAINDQRQQNDLTAARQNRDAVRQARIAMAQASVTSENQGVSGSSSAQGGQGSIVSQMNDTLSFLDKYNYFSDQASEKLGKAESYKANQAAFGQVANASMQVFANAPAISSAASKVFNSGGGE